MEKYIGCDMHKKYSVFVTLDEKGRLEPAVKVSNDLLELRAYLATLPSGAPVAVEATGSWYWFVDELEAAGLEARLVNPLEAKKRMPGTKKTDPGDARGLAMLLRNGTLPEVWIPSAQLRDLRGLLRTRSESSTAYDHFEEPNSRRDSTLWPIRAGRAKRPFCWQRARAISGLYWRITPRNAAVHTARVATGG